LEIEFNQIQIEKIQGNYLLRDTITQSDLQRHVDWLVITK